MLVPQYLMYVAVGDIYSGIVPYAVLHFCSPQVLPVADREHCRVLPAAREAVLGLAHACRIKYLASIRVLVPGLEFLDPARGYVHGLGNMVSGGPFSLLGYDPLYLGFILSNTRRLQSPDEQFLYMTFSIVSSWTQLQI